jgi:hypothetical protein
MTRRTLLAAAVVAGALFGCTDSGDEATTSVAPVETIAVTVEPDADSPGEPLQRVRTTNPDACIDDDQQVDDEPQWPEFGPVIDWYRDGCRVRVDVVTERLPAALDCGVTTRHYIQTAPVIGERQTHSGGSVTYLRRGAETITLDPPADPTTVLPDGVVFTGYESDARRLWADPDDEFWIYLVSDELIERWHTGVDDVCG